MSIIVIVPWKSFRRTRGCFWNDCYYFLIITTCLILRSGYCTTVDDSTGTGCQCMNSTELLAPLENCKTVFGKPGVWFDVVPPACYPLNYGANVCAQHDLLGDERCFLDKNNVPQYCYEPWCYVDINECKKTTESVQRTSVTLYPSLQRNLFYSYSVCNSSVEKWWDYSTIAPLEGRELVVTIPTIWYPVHYKTTTTTTNTSSLSHTSGPEYYNDTLPWGGAILDYFNTIVGLSNLKGVKYTTRSKYGDTIFNYSAYSASILDVQTGLSDMGLSHYWITTPRLGMVMFTRPFAVQQYTLWIPRPTSRGSIAFNALKVFQPFQRGLWGILILVVAFVGVVHVFLVATDKRRGHETTLYRDLHSPEWKQAPVAKKFLILSKLFFDSIVLFFNAMFGFGDEMGTAHSFALKILMFGFYFLTLITVAAFTANLAAFLTLSKATNFISSMEEATEANTPVCAFFFLRDDLETSWPNANFVYFNSNENMFQNYRDGKCAAFSLSMDDILMTEDLMEWLCDNEIVSTNALILEKDIALPIKAKYAAGMSYWISLAQKRGLTYASFEESRQAQAKCRLFYLSKLDGLQPLFPGDFLLPTFLCISCALVAIGVHFRFGSSPSSPKNNATIEKTTSFNVKMLKDNSPGSEEDKITGAQQFVVADAINSMNPNNGNQSNENYPHHEKTTTMEENISELKSVHKNLYGTLQDILANIEATKQKKTA